MSADPSRLDVNILMAMGFPKKQRVDKQLLYTEKIERKVLYVVS